MDRLHQLCAIVGVTFCISCPTFAQEAPRKTPDRILGVPAENPIGRHASLVFFGQGLTGESLQARTRPATPAERSQGAVRSV